MYTTLHSLYNGSSQKNTTLMELTTVQQKCLKRYCIHLRKFRRYKKSHIYYDEIRFDKAVFTNKNEHRFGGNKKNRYINFKKLKVVIFLLQKRRFNACK